MKLLSKKWRNLLMKVSFFEGCVEKQKGIMTKIEFVIFQKSAHRIFNLVN